MILLERSDKGNLIAKIKDDTGKILTKDLSCFDILGNDAFRLLQPIINRFNGTRPRTQEIHLTKLNSSLGHFIIRNKITKLPTNESLWQDFVIELFEYTLCRKDNAANLSSRIKSWNKVIAPAFDLLRDEADIIPLGVDIPRTADRLNLIDITGYHNKVLGDKIPEPAGDIINKLLGPSLLSRTDSEYLDEIRNQQAYLRRVLYDCLHTWWQQIKSYYLYGQKLLHSVEWSELNAQLCSGKFITAGHKHIAASNTDAGLANLLSILIYKHHGAFRNRYTWESKILPSKIVRLPDSIPPAVSKSVSVIMKINWMLGNLSSLDIAACSALLTMQNPMFTPHALLYAKINDKHGKPYLELDNSGQSFRIEKARAKAMKESSLDDLSIDIIKTILEMTSAIRKHFLAQNSLFSDYVFIQHENGIHDVPRQNHIMKKLTGSAKRQDKGLAIYDYFPELIKAGLSNGTISYTKIRSTEGVLEWFRTGSIRAVTRKLGNTQQVVMTHYLPKQLLASWNTRIIRRFQNMWLTVAAANEDFLLEITDFNTLDELHSFLADMLSQHAPTSSLLAEELHKRFSSRLDKSGSKNKASINSRLAIPISKNTLAALYLYHDAALQSGVHPSVLAKPDKITGLIPSQFISLAELLRSQLPHHRDPVARKAHETAIRLASDMHHRLQWSDLLISYR